MLDPYLSVCVPFTYLDLNQRILNGCIEGQAFSQWHNLVPPHPLPPPPPISTSSTGATQKKRPLPDGRVRGGGGRGAKSLDNKKAWSSITHATLSDITVLPPPATHPSPPHHKFFSAEQSTLDMCIQ
jgi:hypothetical protein